MDKILRVADSDSMPIDTDKIKSLREKLGMTQEEAGIKAGFKGRQGWNQLESGRQDNPGIKVLERVAKVLGVKAKDLLK